MKRIFVSTPMTVMSNESFTVFRENVLAVVDFLKQGIKSVVVYYAGIKGKNSLDFADPETAFTSDISTLKDSDLFLLIYPEQSPTSALIELGYALGMKIPIVILVPDRNILPYMVRAVDKVYNNAFVFEYDENDGFLKKIVDNKESINNLLL